MQSEQPSEFRSLMERLNAGDQYAARELLDLYGPHILRVVRRRLHQRLRSRFDSQDFMQEVWTSFFADQPGPDAFERPEALVKFLANMAYHKVVDAFRQQAQTKKNNVNVEQSLESYERKRGAGLAARHATPSREVAAKEEWDEFLRRKPNQYREIIVLLAHGNSCAQIAQQLGLHERTVRRLIQKISPGRDA